MDHPYLPILILLCFAPIFSGAFILLSRFVGPRKPDPEKVSTYECGVEPEQSARQRFSVHFYLVAIVFILFDIEAIFLYPWAIRYRELSRELKFLMFAEMAVFIAILFLGYFYIWRRGVLDWSTHEERLKMLRRQQETDRAA